MPKRKKDDLQELKQDIRTLIKKFKETTEGRSVRSHTIGMDASSPSSSKSASVTSYIEEDIEEIEYLDEELLERSEKENYQEDSNLTSVWEIKDEDSKQEVEEIDQDLLNILGEDPAPDKTYGEEINKNLAERWNVILQSGLKKGTKKKLLEDYKIPENLKLLEAPGLNPETKMVLSESNVKRDKALEAKQNILAKAISALGQGLTASLKQKVNNNIIKPIADTARILCDIHKNETVTRRGLVVANVSRTSRETLLETKPTKLLFGDNLSELIKTTKNLSKSSQELRHQLPQQMGGKTRPTNNKQKSDTLNWRGPPTQRQQTRLQARVAGGQRPQQQQPPHQQKSQHPYNHSSKFKDNSRQTHKYRR